MTRTWPLGEPEGRGEARHASRAASACSSTTVSGSPSQAATITPRGSSGEADTRACVKVSATTTAARAKAPLHVAVPVAALEEHVAGACSSWSRGASWSERGVERRRPRAAARSRHPRAPRRRPRHRRLSAATTATGFAHEARALGRERRPTRSGRSRGASSRGASGPDRAHGSAPLSTPRTPGARRAAARLDRGDTRMGVRAPDEGGVEAARAGRGRRDMRPRRR